jgi:uncharacterized membrane protein YoaK (UPF0700 family)
LEHVVISKLPHWIEYGAFVLALIAGCINAVGLLGLAHQSISHLSGTASLFGASFITSDMNEILNFFMILMSFFLGAAFSGFLLHHRTLKLGPPYDIALYIEAILLFISMYLLMQGQFFGNYLASAACGIQNAMATTYSGAIIRTTHVTGIFTDLGIMFGSALKNKNFDKRKAILFLLIVLGFILGGTLGAFLFLHYSFLALAFPASICVSLAIAYRIANQGIANQSKH